ncbi:transporter [Hyphomicrobium nitrativorans NL23]|uniref:Transporter n=1 Tax=Hyphomicrobium nitrativorans NL23 TaxID=1029756 RepID=V5SCC0_9HYPH|nr:autotransporter domain-containing protein [Hyphomicrobium nitrativorans]AHB47619.1 transporter [Hyphomicrobium nitrativorans NL23]
MLENAPATGFRLSRKEKLRGPRTPTLLIALASLAVAPSAASAQSFNGTAVTSGPFHDGVQYFNHGARLDASAPWAVGGGRQEFRFIARLDATAANAVGGGEQYFYDRTVLNAFAPNAITFGTQRFFNESVLNAYAMNALNGGTQEFHATSRLNASGYNSVSGGTQTFLGTSVLSAATTSAVSGGEQTFRDNSRLNFLAPNAVTGGTQLFYDNSVAHVLVAKGASGAQLRFYDNSTLEADAADAVGHATFSNNSRLNANVANAVSSDDNRYFLGNSALNASAANAVTGGRFLFEDNSTLNAAHSNAINGGTIHLQNSASIQIQATNALTNTVHVYLAGATNLSLNGYGTTIGKIAGNGQIRNGAAHDATLTVDSSVLGDSHFGGVISDGGAGRLNLVKTGAGTLRLFGVNTYTGTTTVNGGELHIAGSIVSSALTVGNGGRLSGAGDGTVGNTTVESGGTVSLGPSRLAVAGDITFSPGSALELRTAYRLPVTGAAHLNGGSVVYLSHSGPVSATQTFTILTANTISGTFNSASTPLAFFDATLAYSPTAVNLTLQRNSLTFADVGQTENQDAAAAVAEAFGFGHALHDAIVVLQAGQALNAFDAISGEIHASTRTALIEDSRFVRNAANDRIRATRDPRPANTEQAFSAQFAGWGHAFGSWGDSSGNQAELSRTTGGILTGIDGLLLDTWRVGALTGYSRSSFEDRGHLSSGTSDSAHLGLYGGTRWAALGIQAGAAYAWHDIEMKRHVVFPGFVEHLTAKDDGGTAQVFGELSYRFDGPATLEPFVGLAHVHLHTRGYTETGGTAALMTESSDEDVTFSTIGLRGSFGFTFGGVDAKAHGMLGWRHGFGNTSPVAKHRFSGSTYLTVAGAPVTEDTAVIEAGMDVFVGDETTFNIGYSGQLASDAQDHGVTASLDIRF